jgi:hypothetical protein
LAAVVAAAAVNIQEVLLTLLAAALEAVQF